MKKLNKKLILEIWDDENPDIDQNKFQEVPQESPVEAPGLTENEKSNYVLSIFTDLQSRIMDLFNYIRSFFGDGWEDGNVSKENKELLRSLNEDVSLMLGKVQQGIKENTEKHVQDVIAQGEEQTQEILNSDDTSAEQKDTI